MIFDILSASYICDYSIEILFSNGKSGCVDFSSYPSRGGIFSRWNDIDEFRKFWIDPEVGNIVWEGEIDIAPETLYSKATGEPLPKWMEAV